MSSSREKGKKKYTFNPAIPPFEGILSSPPPAAEAGPFLPSPVKRPQSNTTTSLRDYTPELDPEQYWNQRLIEARKKSSSNGAFTIQLLTTCLTNFLAEIQKDYTNKCVQLSEHINTLQDENATMAAAINSLSNKTTHYLGSSSPPPEDHSLRQEVGNFRQHTIKELKQLTHDVQKVREQQLLYHQEQREQQREARAAKASAAVAPPPPRLLHHLLSLHPPPPPGLR